MKKIREVLRLKFCLHLSPRKIAKSVGIGRSTVQEYLRRAQDAGIVWPLADNVCDKSLEVALFPAKADDPQSDYDLPNFEYIHQELQRKGVTLFTLWTEYKKTQLNCCCYSQFCRLYNAWRAMDDTWMMQHHKAGESTFIDWAGHTMPIYRLDGLVDFESQIFVAALGASSYTFCEARRSQQVVDWIGSHKSMNEFYGGLTEAWVPDNTKTAVIKANRYESDFQSTYLAAAQHYNVAILPARVRRPQDKSKVEAAVYIVETHILAQLRHHKFFSLEELNLAIKELLQELNQKPFQKMPGSSRYSLFLELEKSILKPLPEVPYEMFYYGKTTLNRGYHIIIEGVPYSVSSTLVGKSVEYRYNERTVEFFFNSKQVALHLRSFEVGMPITKKEHQPIKHQKQAENTPEHIKQRATVIGDSVLNWVTHVLENPEAHLKQRIKTALGVLSLSKTYSYTRLNAACMRGLFYNNLLFKGIEDMLKRNLDSCPLPVQELLKPLPQRHMNVRGANYYV